MVKLVTAREIRTYGPRIARNRGEYVNAAMYIIGTILLVAGFVSQLWRGGRPESGLVVLLVALLLIIAVNLHDLFAHLAGIDYRFSLLGYDTQLALVEVAVPVIHLLGLLLYFLGFLFLFITAVKGHGYFILERHALNMFIAGSVLWLLGSIHNSCQIYERAEAHIQILQQSVSIPFFMGSLMFLIGAVLNCLEQSSSTHHGVDLLSVTLIWLGIFGSLLFLIGGLTNVVKVFEMQQDNGPRLEKLRGGAHERLISEREGQAPLILEEQRRRKMQVSDAGVPPFTAGSTPYKDVLVGGHG